MSASSAYSRSKASRWTRGYDGPVGPARCRKREIVQITDMSAFVAEQRVNVSEWKNGKLITPFESVYVPAIRSEEIGAVHRA